MNRTTTWLLITLAAAAAFSFTTTAAIESPADTVERTSATRIAPATTHQQ